MPNPTPPDSPPSPGAGVPPAGRPSTSAPPTRLKQFKLNGIVFIVGLLVGLIPLSIGAFQLQRERNELRDRLGSAELANSLGSAAVLARHGDYPAALEEASEFYSRAAARLDPAASRPPAEVSTLQSLMTDRDAVIALLARSDPAGADRLAAMYIAYRAGMP